jgi:sigma-E factor negative regulatory protein RseA
MKQYSQDISSLIDNELDDETVVNNILADTELQQQFSRYRLIGDVMRDESDGFDLRMDITADVMAAIDNELSTENVVPLTAKVKPANNVTPFMKRFGQYAIAASVAGVVVVSSLIFNQTADTDPSVAPVLNTVPFGGAVAPVSLQVTPVTTEDAVKEQNERLEALLKDHQLQLQIQPQG